MSERIEEWSVGELARLAGVTVRMLHHYDEIGLLAPRWVGPNGYRYYGRAEAERLQEILALRAGGVPLAEIGEMLAGADRIARLEAHLTRLRDEADRLGKMIGALDDTLNRERKGQHMAIEELYRPFEAHTQESYELWLIDTYGASMAEAIAASKAHLAAAPEGMEDRMAALRVIEADLVAAYEGGAAPEIADLSAHRDWVAAMWGKPCPPAAHAALADTYLAHLDFIARFEALSPGFSQWLPAAMKAAAGES